MSGAGERAQSSSIEVLGWEHTLSYKAPISIVSVGHSDEDLAGIIIQLFSVC